MFLSNPPATAEPTIAPADLVAPLSDLEWRVVWLATRDADRGGCAIAEPRSPLLRRLRRWIEALTGNAHVQRLADERLEALRVFVCATRRGSRRAATAAAELVSAGYPPETVRRLAALTAR